MSLFDRTFEVLAREIVAEDLHRVFADRRELPEAMARFIADARTVAPISPLLDEMFVREGPRWDTFFLLVDTSGGEYRGRLVTFRREALRRAIAERDAEQQVIVLMEMLKSLSDTYNDLIEDLVPA